jgi:hypothetical protein
MAGNIVFIIPNMLYKIDISVTWVAINRNNKLSQEIG